MNRSEYFNDLKMLARQVRESYGIKTEKFGLAEARRVYKSEGIKIDFWPLPYKIKALYMCEEDTFSIALQKSLPDQPKLFAMMHELKHHLVDRVGLGLKLIHCGDYNANQEIEIGAEVFAAEFIYPEDEFLKDLMASRVSNWRPEDVVRFKRSCKAKISYTFICKRLVWFGLVSSGRFDGTRFQKLEEEMYGVPFYRRRRTGISR